MEGGAGTYNPRTPEEVFKDIRGRRAGLIKALTTEAEKFYQLCDPGKENLCLYGLPNETWEVNLPAEEIPPELPEPTLGINFARDGMDEKDWLSLVAIHSDAWLLGVAFYFGAHFGFDEDARRRLFQKINRLPTIFEVVSGTAKKQTKGKTTKKQTKEKTSDSNRSNSKPSRQSEIKTSTMALPRKVDDGEGGEDGEEDEDEHGSTLCGACGDIDADDEFWIGCDGCEGWFHGKCVGITPESAEYVRVYKCPACSSHKRGRA